VVNESKGAVAIGQLRIPGGRTDGQTRMAHRGRDKEFSRRRLKLRLPPAAAGMAAAGLAARYGAPKVCPIQKARA